MWEREVFWPEYRKAAEAVGMDFDVAAPEHLLMADGQAHWRSERLFPARDIIVYSPRANPRHRVDLWSGITTARSLEALGFWLAVPLDAGIALNDKFATAEALRDSPVPLVPSVRITAGRDVHRLDYHRFVPDSWYPVFVKPASWGRGLGCVHCPDPATLDSLLGLASGGDTTMVVQPSVGDVAADTRVVVVEGAVVAMYDRVPEGASHASNVSRGGRVRPRTELEEPVAELVATVQRALDLPYVCIDLLRTRDGRVWLSELEPDGAVTALFDRPDEAIRVIGERFRAYARRHERHLVAAPPGPCGSAS
ncbi:hypothetical protein GCM10027447_18450 [Glycomyces halotolerans]